MSNGRKIWEDSRKVTSTESTDEFLLNRKSESDEKKISQEDLYAEIRDINKVDIAKSQLGSSLDFPISGCMFWNKEMNNTLTESECTQFEISDINLTNKTISIKHVPRREDMFSPSYPDEWMVMNITRQTSSAGSHVARLTSAIYSFNQSTFESKIDCTYENINGSGWAIGDKVALYRYEANGFEWNDNPIIDNEPTQTWRERDVSPNGVFKRSDGTFVMMFTGFDYSGNNSVGYATSTDLINWTVNPTPIFEKGEVPWSTDTQNLGNPFKLENEDMWACLVAGRANPSPELAGIGYVKFTEDFSIIEWSENNDLIDPTADGVGGNTFDSAIGVFAGSMTYYNGKYYCFYNNRSTSVVSPSVSPLSGEKIFVASSESFYGPYTDYKLLREAFPANDALRYNATHTRQAYPIIYKNNIYLVSRGNNLENINNPTYLNQYLGLSYYDPTVNTMKDYGQNPIMINPIQYINLYDLPEKNNYLWNWDHLGEVAFFFIDEKNARLMFYFAANAGTDTYAVGVAYKDISEVI